MRILTEISSESYSSVDFQRELACLAEEDENQFITIFLQFIVDCSGFEIEVTSGMYFDDILSRHIGFQIPNPEVFVYSKEFISKIEPFLRDFLVEIQPFRFNRWFSNVLGLLRTMAEMPSIEMQTTGLFFCIQILFEFSILRSSIRMDVRTNEYLSEHCLNLIDLFKIELLNEENVVDVSKKIIYLIETYPELFLNENPGNLKKLTTLLFIDNNQIKANVLKSLLVISESSVLSEYAQEALKTDLLSLRNLLISLCHTYPLNVTTNALNLILRLGPEFIAAKEDKDKIYLVLTSSNKKLQEFAATFFMASYKEYENEENNACDSSAKMLQVLEEFIPKYSESMKNLPNIIESLFEHLPDIVEIYMYILSSNSMLWSKLSTLIVKHSIKVNSLSRLFNIPAAISGTLQKVENPKIYIHILQNLSCFNDIAFSEIQARDFEKIIQILVLDYKDKPFEYYLLLQIAMLIKRIYKFTGERFHEDIAELFNHLVMEDDRSNESIVLDKLTPVIEVFKTNVNLFLMEEQIDLITPLLNRKVCGYSIRIGSIFLLNRFQRVFESDSLEIEELFKELDIFVEKINSNYFNQDPIRFSGKEILLVSESMFDLLQNIKFKVHGSSLTNKASIFDITSTKFLNFILKAFEKFIKSPTNCNFDFEKMLASLSNFLEYAPNLTDYKNLHRIWSITLMHPLYQKFIERFLENVYKNDHLNSVQRQEFLCNIFMETLYGLNFMNESVSQPTKFLLQSFLKTVQSKESQSTEQTIKADSMRLFISKIATYMEKVCIHELNDPIKGEHRFKVINYVDSALADLSAQAKTDVIRSLNKLSTLKLSEAELRSVRKATSILNSNVGGRLLDLAP